MKTSSVIVGVVLVVLVGIVALNVDERMDRLEERVEAAEAALAPLDPLGRLMRGAGAQGVEGAYEARQATGAPDVPAAGGDSALAWCPAEEDGGEEWLRLEFEAEVRTVGVRVYENFNPGAVVGLEVGGEEVEAVGGVARDFSGQVFVLGKPTVIKSLELRLDTAKVAGWNEIDAVALVDAAGVEHWASGAEASSVWERK